ncbi:MAG: DNA polymerase III subunit gamma/tau [bacterium]|nr:DNA polymerase III subunit gamma/tau [bacterium]
MTTSLYRKHRPQKFSDITGQRHVLTTLKHQLETDRVAHAYLFAGPRGTGKTTTSRVLAKAVNCLQRKPGSAEPCNDCIACTSITVGNALDVLEIDAASHTGVDHVREHIIGNTRVAPTSLRWKVFIIDEVHMLSLAAFNALLKTLEEPPANVLFVLATTEVAKLPPTIVSRCQRFDFKKVSAPDMAERLVQLVAREGRTVGEEAIAAIVANADGSVRDAESVLEQVLALGDDPITLDQARLVIPYTDAASVIEFLRAMVGKQTTQALELLGRLAADGVDMGHFANEVTDWLRRLLLVKSGVRASELGVILTPAQEQVLSELVARPSAAMLVTMLSVWVSRANELRFATIPQLPLELAVVELCMGNSPVAAPAPVSAAKAEPPVAPGGGSTMVKPAADEPKKPAGRKAAKTAAAKAATKSEPEQAVPPAAAQGESPRDPPVATLESLQNQWPTIVAQVKTQNYSLFSLLRVTRVVEVSGDVVRVGVAYDFHLERVREPKNRHILEQTIAAAIGKPVRLEVVVVPADSGPAFKAADAALQPLLENFGGTIVE